MEILERDRDAIFQRIDEQRIMIEKTNQAFVRIETVLVGMHGDNGLKGEVKHLDREFMAFRAEMQEARTADRDERKASVRFTVGTVITVGGLIVAALRMFI